MWNHYLCFPYCTFWVRNVIITIVDGSFLILHTYVALLIWLAYQMSTEPFVEYIGWVALTIECRVWASITPYIYTVNPWYIEPCPFIKFKILWNVLSRSNYYMITPAHQWKLLYFLTEDDKSGVKWVTQHVWNESHIHSLSFNVSLMCEVLLLCLLSLNFATFFVPRWELHQHEEWLTRRHHVHHVFEFPQGGGFQIYWDFGFIGFSFLTISLIYQGFTIQHIGKTIYFLFMYVFVYLFS